MDPRKKLQRQYEDCMDELRVMENYLAEQKGGIKTFPSLHDKIQKARNVLALFQIRSAEKEAPKTEKELHRILQNCELIIKLQTLEEKAEIAQVLVSLQDKKSDASADYQWIKECFKGLGGGNGKKTLISFFIDLAKYIKLLIAKKEPIQSPSFFKPPSPMWSREAERKVLKEKTSDDNDPLRELKK